MPLRRADAPAGPLGRADASNDAPRFFAPLQARDKLRWVNKQLEAGLLDEKALDWLERRANGESLAELAKSEGIDPAAMRQRLCYHRTRLREGWDQQGGGTGSVPPPSSPKASIPDFPFVSQPQPLR